MFYYVCLQAGVFSRFDFPNIPGPFNGLVGILRNNDMLSFVDKLRESQIHAYMHTYIQTSHDVYPQLKTRMDTTKRRLGILFVDHT